MNNAPPAAALSVITTARAPDRDPSLNLHQRMLAVMQTVGYIPKEGVGPEAQGSYRFARVEHIKDAVRDALIAAGVMVHVSFTDRTVEILHGTDRQGKPRDSILVTTWGTMTFVNVDSPEEQVVVEIQGQGIDSQDKALSKAMTSADKYGLLNAFQIPTGADPDETGEDVPTTQRRAAPRTTERPATASRRPESPPRAPAPVASGGDADDDAPPWPMVGDHCPKHDKAWRSGRYGWFCAAKDDTTESGYCTLRPSKEWAARAER